MFINTGGFHGQHNSVELHPQHKRHHHGDKHPQQFGQHYPTGWTGHLAAPGHRLLPGPRRHGSRCPSALLLKARAPQTPPPHPITRPQASTSSYLPTHSKPHSSPLHRTARGDHKANMDGL